MSIEANISQFQNFIGTNHELVSFLHNTESEEIAKAILSEGFRFEGYLDFTTDQLSGSDEIELKYFLHKRLKYGKYTIVIQISKELINKYSAELNDAKHHYSELFAIETTDGPDLEPIFTLSQNFIKGYFDHSTGNKVKNPIFDPNLELAIFKKNLQRIKNE